MSVFVVSHVYGQAALAGPGLIARSHKSALAKPVRTRLALTSAYGRKNRARELPRGQWRPKPQKSKAAYAAARALSSEAAGAPRGSPSSLR